MIECSDFLQANYSRACYGTADLPSLNFKGHAWLAKDKAGDWISPYKRYRQFLRNGMQSGLMPCVRNLERRSKMGVAAIMTYAKMQFVGMKEEERAFMSTLC